MSKEFIRIGGAREHNLKNITLQIPRDKLGLWSTFPDAPKYKAYGPQIVKTFGAGGGLNGGPLYGYAVTATSAGGGTISTVIPDTDANAHNNCVAAGDTVAIQFVFNG